MLHNALGYVRFVDDQTNYLLKGLFPMGGGMNIMGASKAGKSYLALQLAEAVMNPARTKFMIWDVMHHGPVIYIQLDTSRVVWSWRIKKLWLDERQQTQFGTIERLWIIDKVDAPGFDLLDQRREKWLIDVLYCPDPAIEPVMVIVDVIREVYAGNENDNEVLRAVISKLENVIRPASLCVISHTRKEQQNQGTSALFDMDVNRGSTYLNGRMDVLFKLVEGKLVVKSRMAENMWIPIRRTPHGIFEVTGEPRRQGDDDNDAPLRVQQELESLVWRRKVEATLTPREVAERSRRISEGIDEEPVL